MDALYKSTLHVCVVATLFHLPYSLILGLHTIVQSLHQTCSSFHNTLVYLIGAEASSKWTHNHSFTLITTQASKVINSGRERKLQRGRRFCHRMFSLTRRCVRLSHCSTVGGLQSEAEWWYDALQSEEPGLMISECNGWDFSASAKVNAVCRRSAES